MQAPSSPFLRNVAVFFWSDPIWHMEKIWGCGGLKILNKRTQLESEVLFLLLERCQQIFDEDVEFWDVQHAKQQLETWGKTSWNQDEVTYVPIHPPLTARKQGPCLGRRSALGKRASECQQPGKSYEWLVDGGGQRAFHSLHPAGDKNQNLQYCVCGAYESSTTQVHPLQSSIFFTTLNHNLVNHHSHQSSHIFFVCLPWPQVLEPILSRWRHDLTFYKISEGASSSSSADLWLLALAPKLCREQRGTRKWGQGADI